MKASMFKKVLAFALCVWMVCVFCMSAFAATGQPYEEVQSVQINPSSLSMVYGGTAKLTATVYPSGANPKVIWQSSDPSLVTVDSHGNLTAAKDNAETPSGKKTVTITVTSDEKSSAKATCTVTVDNDNETKTKSTLNSVIDTLKSMAANIDFNKIVELFKSIDLSKIKDIFDKVIEVAKQLVGVVGNKTTTAA